MIEKEVKYRKAGVVSAIFVALIVSGVFVYVNSPKNVEPEQSWHTVWEGNLDKLAEADPGAGVGGFLSIFCLDYGETPETVLANNATDWNTTGGTVHGYADYDNFVQDLVSQDPVYFVVRGKFTAAQGMDNGVWTYEDMRCTLTVSGDEAFNTTTYDNASGGKDAAISDSYANEIWINFFWDDDDNGYRILEDGEIVVEWIKLEAKY